jgi:hypothetical protein
VRSSYVGKFFVVAIRKNKDLYEYFKNIKNYDVNDIENSTWSRWWKDRFIELKNLNWEWTEDNENSLYNNNEIVVSYKEDGSGVVYKWIGNDMFISTESSQILLVNGDYFMKMSDGLFLGHSWIGPVKEHLDKVEEIGIFKITEYKNLISDILRRKK